MCGPHWTHVRFAGSVDRHLLPGQTTCVFTAAPFGANRPCPAQGGIHERHATWLRPAAKRSRKPRALFLREREREREVGAHFVRCYHQIGSGAYGLELHTLPAPTLRDRLPRLQDRWLHPRRALQTHPKTAGFRNLATDLLITENGELGSTCTRRRW